MTEPIAVDVAAKPLAYTRSAMKPAEKSEPSAGPFPKPAEPPPTGRGLRARLGEFVAVRATKKQAAIGASALFSLAVGIAGVRLMWPPEPAEQPQTAAAILPIADEVKPAAPPSVIQEPPTLVPEPIPATGLPTIPMTPEAAPALPVVTPAAPAGGSVTPSPDWGTFPGPALPVRSTDTPATPDKEKAALPPPLDQSALAPTTTPAVIPVSGTGTPPAGTGMGSGGGTPSLPMLPGAPTSLPAAPVAPMTGLPGAPTIPDPKTAAPAPINLEPAPKLPLPGVGPSSGTGTPAPVLREPTSLLDPLGPAAPKDQDKDAGPARPPAPVQGSAVTPVVPVQPETATPKVPTTGGAPLTPAPDGFGPGGGGAKLELVKPANDSTVTPAAAVPDRAANTSYDVDIYDPNARDTYESISREYYSDQKYAAALRAYNRNKPLQGAGIGPIDIPPIHVLKRLIAPQPIPGASVPVGRTGSGYAPEWGAPVSVAGGTKTYRVPAGDGMSMQAIARVTLGSEQRWTEIYDLNPALKADKVPEGTDLKLPANARLP